MKLILLLFIFISATCFAQNEHYSISSHFGYGLSYITKYLNYNSESNTTYNTGIEIRKQMGNEGFYIQTGIRLNEYSWKNTIEYVEWNGNGFDKKTNVNSTYLSFISIPLIATYKFKKTIPNLTISAGPQISLLSSRKWKQNGNILSSQWQTPDLNFSTFLSIGYEQKINKNWIIGGEFFSNFFQRKIYNFGIGLSGRYIFKQFDSSIKQKNNPKNEKYSISSHFGYSLSQPIHWDYQTDYRSTFNAGIEIRKQIGQKGFYLQSGIRWNEYGYKETSYYYNSNSEGYTIQAIEHKSTSFFLTIPLIATYKFNKIAPGFTVSAGPQMSFYMFSKKKNNDETYFIKNNDPLLNLGIHFSTGYEHYINENWIIGGEVYSNLNFPIHSFFGFEGDRNSGLAISGRYILK